MREWRGEATAFSVYSLGQIAAKRGQWAEANAYFQRVYVGYQKFLPWVAKAYIASGESFEKLGKTQEATNTYRELLRNEKLANFSKPPRPGNASRRWETDDEDLRIAFTPSLVFDPPHVPPAPPRPPPLLVTPVHAQNILLKTGQTIETKGVRRSGDMVMGKIQVGASSGEVGYQVVDHHQDRFSRTAAAKNHRGIPQPGRTGKGARRYRPGREIL